MNKLTIILMASSLMAQTPKNPLLVTQRRVTTAFVAECGGVPVCLDNRSTFLRYNNYHSFAATGPGTWSVTMDFSDASIAGPPWTSFGSAAVVTQASNPPIGYGNGYHNFVHFTVSGANSATVVIQYSGSRDYFISAATSSLTFPLTVPQGGTGLTTFTTNGIPYGQGSSALGVTAAGSQYQVFQAGGSGVPGFGAVHLDQSAAITGICPVANGCSGLASIATNSIPYGQGTSPLALLAAGSQYQVYQAGASGVPSIGPIHLDQSAAITGICPIANGCTGAGNASAALTNILGSRTQGQSSQNVAMAKGSFTTGNVPKLDVDGNLVDSGFTPSTTPTGTAVFQRFRSGTPSTFTGAFVAPSAYYMSDFNFTAISPSGSLAVGNNTITFPGLVPMGVNWNSAPGGTSATNGNANTHYLYVAGTGTPEACNIVSAGPGTATEGTTGGTITINCANTHSAGYTIQSASGGMQEVYQHLYTFNPGLVIGSSATIYQKVTWPKLQFTFDGNGSTGGVLTRSSIYANGTLLYVNNAACCFQEIKNFGVNNGTGGSQSGAIALYIYASSFMKVTDFTMGGGNEIIRLDGTGTMTFDRWNMSADAQTLDMILLYSSQLNNGCNGANCVVSFTNGKLFPGANAVGFHIQAADGLTIDHVQGSQGTPWLQFIPAGSFVNGFYVANTVVSNNICDEYGTSSEYCVGINNAAGTGLGGIHFTGNTFNGSSSTTPFGIISTDGGSGVHPFAITIDGNIISQPHGPAVYLLNTDDVNISGNILACTSTAGNGCIRIEGGDSPNINGNNVFSSNTVEAITFGGTATTNATVVGNRLYHSGSAPVKFNTAVASLTMNNNTGLDNVQGTVADAATITLPVHPSFTLTGTGTAITTVTTDTCWAGRHFIMVATNASPPQFTAGATIGNTLTPTQNVPVVGYCDGTKVYLK